MADQNTNKQIKEKLHPGSSEADAKAVGGSGDFGVAENDVVGRNYTSRNTKLADRGVAPQRSGESEDAVRTSGAGGTNSGPGSSSGGELDTDLSGLSLEKDFAPLPPAKTGTRAPKFDQSKGCTVQYSDANSNDAQGADAEPNAEDGSDASVGEVSRDEASGRNDAD